MKRTMIRVITIMLTIASVECVCDGNPHGWKRQRRCDEFDPACPMLFQNCTTCEGIGGIVWGDKLNEFISIECTSVGTAAQMKEKGIVPKIMYDDLAIYKKYISPNYLNGIYNVKKTIENNYNDNDSDFRKDCDEEYKKYKDIFKISGDISRKNYCNIITNNHIGKSSKDYFVDFMKQRDGAKVMTYNQAVKEWNWCDESDYVQQMKLFKKHIKNGIMKVKDYNNNEHDLNGVKWYSMCLQQYDYNGEFCGNMDIGSMEIFSYMITGFVYYYKNKTDRDAMFSHLNKYQK